MDECSWRLNASRTSASYYNRREMGSGLSLRWSRSARTRSLARKWSVVQFLRVFHPFRHPRIAELCVWVVKRVEDRKSCVDTCWSYLHAWPVAVREERSELANCGNCIFFCRTRTPDKDKSSLNESSIVNIVVAADFSWHIRRNRLNFKEISWPCTIQLLPAEDNCSIEVFLITCTLSTCFARSDFRSNTFRHEMHANFTTIIAPAILYLLRFLWLYACTAISPKVLCPFALRGPTSLLWHRQTCCRVFWKEPYVLSQNGHSFLVSTTMICWLLPVMELWLESLSGVSRSLSTPLFWVSRG